MHQLFYGKLTSLYSYKRPDGSDYPMEECPLDNANAQLVRVQNQTEVFVKKDGTLFPVIWSCAPLERLGKTVGAVIEFRDVTEERKLEQERFQANLVSNQQQIRIKEAESHRQRMSQFVDYIAHELRNPLVSRPSYGWKCILADVLAF